MVGNNLIRVPGVMKLLEPAYEQHCMERALVSRERYRDANAENWRLLQQAGYSDDGKTLNQWGIDTGELWFGDETAGVVSHVLYHQRWWTYARTNVDRIKTAIHWRLKGLSVLYTLNIGDHSWSVEISDHQQGVHIRIFRIKAAKKRYAAILSECYVWSESQSHNVFILLEAARQVAQFLDADDDLNAPAFPYETAHETLYW